MLVTLLGFAVFRVTCFSAAQEVATWARGILCISPTSGHLCAGALCGTAGCFMQFGPIFTESSLPNDSQKLAKGILDVLVKSYHLCTFH